MAAVISSCGTYRYRLERDISMFGSAAAVVMVNPSTADAQEDDATIRRLLGFGKRLGWSQIVVANVFAYRATDVSELARADDPVGPENARHLQEVIEAAPLIVVAWGSLLKLPQALRREWEGVPMIAKRAGKDLYCLGLSSDGHPRHPLMLSYQAELVRWAPPS